MTMETAFAPAERASKEQVEQQHNKLAALPFVQEFLDAVPNMAMVLNQHRQIVFANGVFREFAGVDDATLIGARQTEVLGGVNLFCLGERPGEAIGCVRAGLTEGGCGTTEFCRTCGAVQSIENCQKNDAPDVQECRLVCGETEESLDLRVWSRPIIIDGETFTIFSVMDISNEKRRKALERIFFHDVLNTAGGMKGLADLLVETGATEMERNEVARMLSESAEQLIDEICAQRMLSAAERGELQVAAREINSMELVCRIVRQFHSADCSRDKNLVVSESAERFDLVSDPVLIRRVLVNMTKNALEAAGPGGTVTLDCVADASEARFSVHNDMIMPLETQRQLFARSFSTKGVGRGLGTYSMKLITEKYLQGRVSFVSNAEQGTVFTVCYPKQIAARSGDEEIWEVDRDAG